LISLDAAVVSAESCRGWGLGTTRSSLILPGCALVTTTREPMKIASSMSCVTKRP